MNGDASPKEHRHFSWAGRAIEASNYLKNLSLLVAMFHIVASLIAE